MASRSPAQRLRRLAARLRTPTSNHPEQDADASVSLVVATSNVQEPFLDECLDSLVRQTHDDLRILVVPYGECDRVAAIAETYAAREPRLSVYDAAEQGLGSARNLGAEQAEGRYLAFIGAADVLPRVALHKLVSSLESSASDFVIGSVDDHTRLPGAPSVPRHRASVAGVTIEEFPAGMSDVLVENRLFRTEFWRSSGLVFPDADGPGMDLPVVMAALAASKFDVLADVTYKAMQRGSGHAVGSATNVLGDLAIWIQATRDILGLFPKDRPAARDAWLCGVLNAGVAPFLDDTERATADQWRQLTGVVRDLLDGAGDRILPQIPVEPRVRAWLVANDRRGDLEEFVVQRLLRTPEFPSEVADGVAYARLPFFRDPAVGVPDWLYVLDVEETPLVLSLRRQCWTGDGQLELEIFAFIERIGMEHIPPAVTVSLVEESSRTRIELPVVQRSDAAVSRLAWHRHQGYAQGALTVTVDAAALAAQSDDESLWRIEVTLTAEGITRSDRVSHRDLDGSAGALERIAVDGALMGLVQDGPSDLFIKAVRPTVWLKASSVTGRVVSGSLVPAAETVLTHVTAVRDPGERLRVPIIDEDGELRFRLELPDGGTAGGDEDPRAWRLRAVGDGLRHPISWPADVPELWMHTSPSADLALQRNLQGNVQICEARQMALIDDVALGDAEITFRGRWLGRPPASWSLQLQGRRATITADVTMDTAGSFEAGFSLRWDEWSLGETFVPLGVYRPVLLVSDSGTDTSEGALLTSTGLTARCPEDQLSSAYRLRLARTSSGSPLVMLRTPYRDDQLGPFAQTQLREGWAAKAEPLDERAVYLQSYTGHTATDSQLAIHHELRRARPDLVLYWGVANWSTRLPEGAVPILMHTHEWYDLMARAKYLVNNVDFERWFERKPGQRVLQTFHGYPAKSMGIRMWKAKQFTPGRIQTEIERTSRDWDLILTPVPEMDEYYRREYAYDGPILSHGYPRDDVLVSAEGELIRTQTRARLEIGQHQKVILYAPTWRDDLATSYKSAPIAGHLDLETACQALGDEYVLLMRGHRFHSTGRPQVSRGARLIDVTSYPEVNDLILAADAAVLDYSSMRFDFALTGRPMLFLVPDLHLYTGAVRGFLFDYKDSAPGPLPDTADEVVELLRDLDGVAETYRDAYERFNAKYNYLQDGQSAKHVVREFFDPA